MWKQLGFMFKIGVIGLKTSNNKFDTDFVMIDWWGSKCIQHTWEEKGNEFFYFIVARVDKTSVYSIINKLFFVLTMFFLG